MNITEEMHAMFLILLKLGLINSMNYVWPPVQILGKYDIADLSPNLVIT